MSALAILPYVWAFAEPQAERPSLPAPSFRPPRSNLAFYRKYTHALLRRYVRMSLEAGRTPSLLGQEMFRAKISHHRVESFEDVVIFLHDVERCLEKLSAEEQIVVARISLQEFTIDETAAMLGMNQRTMTSAAGLPPVRPNRRSSRT